MYRRIKNLPFYVMGTILFAPLLSQAQQPPASSPTNELPNIVWITSEDNSPFLGCYGDTFATTPRLDALAEEGVLYLNAFANAPVCAPARFTILTGVHATSTGTHHMRSTYKIPSYIKGHCNYLKERGYYCTNPGKTDYNYSGTKVSWDAGTYTNRAPGQPFFHIHNIFESHESRVFGGGTPRHDRQTVPFAPYHPDTSTVRHNWAKYYDCIEEMDALVGEFLDQLERDGVLEDTIVFYYADHGGVLGRSKRFVYETGTRVPMIIRFPERFQYLAPGLPGSRTDRMVSFVDLAPTLLSLAGIAAPEHMEGVAFLGEHQAAAPQYVHLFRGRMDERYDAMRAVRDNQYRYIRNYMPHRIYGQKINFLWKAKHISSWQNEYYQGRCNAAQSIFWNVKPAEELYDVAADPWEINNLADDPAYLSVLERMRAENARWVRASKDIGFIPEGEMRLRTGGTTAYELVRQDDFPMERIIETAEMATTRNPAALPELITRLEDDESCVRFWAATGCSVLGTNALDAVPALTELLSDPSADVQIAAAEALCYLGEIDPGLSVLTNQLFHSNGRVALRSANTLDALGARALPALPAIQKAASTGGREVKDVTNYTKNRLAAMEPYDVWASTHGVTAGPTSDQDHDGRSNLQEYAFGNDTDPILVITNDTFEYCYTQRAGDTNLTYEVQTTTNLMPPTWTFSGELVTITNTTGETFDEVRSTLPADLKQAYIRLKITN